MTRKGVWSRRVLSIAPGESTSRNTKLHIRVHVCLVLRALDSLRKALRQQWGAFGVVVSNVKVFGKGGFLILCFGFCRPPFPCQAHSYSEYVLFESCLSVSSLAWLYLCVDLYINSISLRAPGPRKKEYWLQRVGYRIGENRIAIPKMFGPSRDNTSRISGKKNTCHARE